MTDQPIVERRKDVRVPEEIRVLVRQGPGARESARNHAFTRNLSVGGAQIETDRFFPPETELALTLFLSGSNQLVDVGGKVRWIRDSEPGLFLMGVKFAHAEPGTILAVMNHVFRKNAGVLAAEPAEPEA